MGTHVFVSPAEQSGALTCVMAGGEERIVNGSETKEGAYLHITFVVSICARLGKKNLPVTIKSPNEGALDPLYLTTGDVSLKLTQQSRELYFSAC